MGGRTKLRTSMSLPALAVRDWRFFKAIRSAGSPGVRGTTALDASRPEARRPRAEATRIGDMDMEMKEGGSVGRVARRERKRVVTWRVFVHRGGNRGRADLRTGRFGWFDRASGGGGDFPLRDRSKDEETNL